MALSTATMVSSLWPLLLALMPLVVADDPEYMQDPYLAYRPPFARSLPVQIMLTGVILTLVAVLFIHLMFTAQYHWPLAPVNYVLQLSGVTTLLISLIATIHVVLSATFTESEKWPYMLSYIAVNVPPLDLDDEEGWSFAERATWLVMNASTSALIQITHIQFLTLLYPSRLEGRLIFALLGPLAVVAAVMQLLPMIGSDSVYSIASAVRNVCNATLSLLFTLALFIWGLLVNRKSAWRTDGGTAVFGCAALSLAVVSTALNFLYVHKEEEFVWLPGLMWAVVLWQSFLGWWWWVGAGSGGAFASEDEKMEERLRRQAKRDARRKEKRERKKEAKLMNPNKVWRGVTGAFSTASDPGVTLPEEGGRTTSREPSIALSHRHPSQGRRRITLSDNQNTNEDDTNNNNNHTDNNNDPLTPHRRLTTSTTLLTPTSPTSRTRSTPTSSGTTSTSAFASETGTSASTSGTVTDTTTHTGMLRQPPRMVPGMIYRWYTSLRRAHNAAARVQAAERVERMKEMGAVTVAVAPADGGSAQVNGEGGIRGNGNDNGNMDEEKENAGRNQNVNGNGRETTTRKRETVEVDGWGFGWEGLGWRRRRTVYEERPAQPITGSGGGAAGEYEMERRRRRDRRNRTLPRGGENENENEEGYVSSSLSVSDKDVSDDDDEDIYVSDKDSDNRNQYRQATPTRRQNRPPPEAVPGPGSPVDETKPRSVWWWGPLGRWRLQDSTVYR